MHLMAQFQTGSRFGVCSVHGSESPNGEPVVCTGITIDYEGDFDICASCVREMAALVGLVDRTAQVEALSTELVEALDYSRNLYDRTVAAEATNEHLAAALARVVAERDEARQAADALQVQQDEANTLAGK